MRTPIVGSELTISLPGESLRATVTRVLCPTAVQVELTSQPMTKGHLYRKGDTITCLARHTVLEAIWEATDDRDFVREQATKRKGA